MMRILGRSGKGTRWDFVKAVVFTQLIVQPWMILLYEPPARVERTVLIMLSIVALLSYGVLELLGTWKDSP